ncbi:MAG: T9SS type A sorting domain-containing protein [Flavobacteriales bacterium]|nr:T9SS type A sorting domain-containing protein [Flavobacteriales bacterium]
MFHTTCTTTFAAINGGGQGGANILVEITGNTTETGTAVLNQGAWTTLTVQPSGGASRTITGNLAAPLINLNGADNVTIDGLNTGGNSLTISNTNNGTTSGTCTIQFIADAVNNLVTRCTLLGSFSNSAITTNGGVVFFGAGAIATGCDNNTISFCDVGPAGSNLPVKAFHFGGSSGSEALRSSGNVIDNCSIYDFFLGAGPSAGVYVSSNDGTTELTISNNRFYQTAARSLTSSSQHSSIWIANANGNGFQVTGNTIGYASSTGTGTYTFSGIGGSTFVPIFLNTASVLPSNVTGNTITAIALSGAMNGTLAASVPVRLIGSNVGAININNNTIGSQSALDAITFTTSSGSNADVNAIHKNGAGTLNTNGNQIGGITVGGTGVAASRFYGMRANNAAGTNWTCNGNTIGGTVANSIRSTTTNTATQVQGIMFFDANLTAENNLIRNLTAANGTGANSTVSVGGIVCQNNTGTRVIRGNTIHSLSNTNALGGISATGINFEAVVSATNVVEGNFIHSLRLGSGGGTMNGIYIGSGGASIRNNMVRLGIDADGASITPSIFINGIYENGGTNTIWHNSVYIGGAGVVGTNNTWALFSNVTVTRDIRNNILWNARSNGSGSGSHLAIRVNSTNMNTNLTSDHNCLRVTGTGGVLGNNGANRIDLAAWQASFAPATKDQNSFSSDPLFIAPEGPATGVGAVDLHIQPASGSPVDATGVLIAAVAVDFDGDDRTDPLTTPVDIGADAGNFSAGSPCSGLPDAGTASALDTELCDGESAVLESDAVNTDSGIVYQWMVSNVTGGPYSNATGTGATTLNFSSSALAPGTYYFVLRARCVNETIPDGDSFSNEVEVTVYPTPAPTVNAGGPVSFCPGGSVTLSSSIAGDSYLWVPGGSTDPSIVASAAGSYTVTVTTNGCPGTSPAVVVSILPAPSGVTADASELAVCAGDEVDLFGAVSTLPPHFPLNEGFNAPTSSWTNVNNSSGGSPPNGADWTLRPNGYNPGGGWSGAINSNDASQFFLASRTLQGGSGTADVELISPPFSTLGVSTASLSFFHFLEIFDFNGFGRVEVSTDGSAWTTVANYPNTSIGSRTNFFNQVLSLNAYVGEPTLYLKFRYRQTFGNGGWAIDNVSVSGAAIPAYSWTSDPAGFSSGAQNPTGVQIDEDITFTLTVTHPSGCTTSDDVTVSIDLTDGDGDGIPDCVDSCPLVFGEVGDPCDDGYPDTVLDVLGGDCICAGEPCTADLYIAYDQTTNYQDVVWTIYEQSTNIAVQTGGFGPGAGSATTCVPDGCYYLRVTNSGGNVVSGGYRLVLDSANVSSAYGNLRIIDNRGNLVLGPGGDSGISNNEGFCITNGFIGSDEPIYTSCDRYWWKSGDYLVASENATVSAEFGGPYASTSGYEFWFYDPNGGLSFRKTRVHTVSDGFAPNNAVRACHIKLNNWAAASHLQNGVLYNVRIRGVVAGNPIGEYGPACRVVLDPVLAQCHPTGLNDIPGNPNFSCGVDRIWGGPNQLANRIFCRPVAGANRYQWEFTNANETYTAILETTGVQRHLNWSSQPAMQTGSSYQVRVRASKDNGGTWCEWGWTCQVTIVPSAAPGNENLALEGEAASNLALWPNPNNGQQVWITLDELAAEVGAVAVDLYDLSGQRVMAREIATQGGHLYTNFDLGGIAAGTYLVSIIAGEQQHVKRLVVQP